MRILRQIPPVTVQGKLSSWMRLDVFGRELIVERDGDTWAVFHPGEGKRRVAHDVSIPAEVPADRVAEYLADLLHEFATPDHPRVRRLA